MVSDAALLPAVEQVWTWLAEVPDPEIPVISVVDLGIVRGVAWDGDTLEVTVTPTYSGCPAAAVIERDIARHLRACGIARLRLKRGLSPPWTTDWISAEGREKLRAYGIAPPVAGTAADGGLRARAGRLAARRVAVACPCCGSGATEIVSQFGSTPCKASYRCRDCLEPFDYFKCL
jgi:ring-1,2-phenylacetyl-CoA epoxidase subunit PaaD